MSEIEKYSPDDLKIPEEMQYRNQPKESLEIPKDLKLMKSPHLAQDPREAQAKEISAESVIPQIVAKELIDIQKRIRQIKLELRDDDKVEPQLKTRISPEEREDLQDEYEILKNSRAGIINKTIERLHRYRATKGQYLDLIDTAMQDEIMDKSRAARLNESIDIERAAESDDEESAYSAKIASHANDTDQARLIHSIFDNGEWNKKAWENSREQVLQQKDILDGLQLLQYFVENEETGESYTLDEEN